jgi:hypothetical protein
MGVRTAAAAPKVPTRLVWHGSICGTAEGFVKRVLERTNAVRFVRQGQRLAVRLRIERRRSGLDASVSIEARGRAPLLRHIESPDCEDALDALALVVAIGIEGRSAPAAGAASASSGRRRSSAQPAQPAPEAPSEGPAAPAPEPAAASPPSEPVAEVEVAPAAEAPLSPPEPPATPPDAAAASTLAVPPEPRAPEVDTPLATPVDATRPFQVRAGVSAEMSLGIAPDPLIGGAVWLSTAWERRGLWSPELIVSAMHQRLDGLSIADGEVDFALSAAGVSICPLRVGSPIWKVRPCVTGVLGRLATEGHDTYDPRSLDRPWRALGGTLELTAAIGIVELRATLGATAPLVRDGFRFGATCSGAACEADVFHRVAPVIWSGAAGAGIRFW